MRAIGIAAVAIGAFALTDAAPALAASNDAFATPIVLSGRSVDTAGDNFNATAQSGEPANLNGPTLERTLWYRWQAPAGGTVDIDTCDSVTDASLAVYVQTGGGFAGLQRRGQWVTGCTRDTVRIDDVVADTTLFIQVDTYFDFISEDPPLNGGPFNLHIRQRPVNDAFAKAGVITGPTATINGDNRFATAEAGEPNHGANGTPAASVWYRWTAPESGPVTVDTCDAGFDTALGVYQGDALNALAVVGKNDDDSTALCGDSIESRVDWVATAGEEYRIAVDGFGGDQGAVILHVTQSPGNNARASAELLGGDSHFVTWTNVNATKEAGEPNHAGNAGGHSVWWQWTAPQKGVVTIDTCGSDFDTLLAVYKATGGGGLQAVKTNNNTAGCGPTGRGSRVQFEATQGVAYLIAIDGADGAVGSVALGIHQAAINDTFAKSTTISGLSPSATGNNRNATEQPGEPDHADNLGGASVWYRWVATSTGLVAVDTCGSDFDTLLGVYRGSAVDGLTEVAANDDSEGACGLQSETTFRSTQGTVYWIAVDGFRSEFGTVAQGAVALHLLLQPDPKLSVSVSGAGSVASSPPGINCGNGAMTCSRQFLPDTVVALTPNAASGSVFDHWGGACSGSGSCQVTMNANKSVSAVFKPATRKPDGQIKLDGGTFVGNNVYNATGAAQTAATTAPAGGSRKFVFLVENDGNATDAIKVQGCAAGTGFTVSYKLGNVDVTAAVQAGTQQFASVAPGGTKSIVVTIASLAGTANGSVQSCSIKATSVNDPTKSDTTIARLTVG